MKLKKIASRLSTLLVTATLAFGLVTLTPTPNAPVLIASDEPTYTTMNHGMGA